MKELILEQSELPQGWYELVFKHTVTNVPLTGKKLKRKEYLQSGKFPVIDQGQDFIGGFTNKKELLVRCNLPVVIFGDHTKVIKFVNQDFVAGADGIKVLKNNSLFDPKLLYYFTQAIRLPNKGYARHYQFLAKSLIRVPPLPEQKRIVSKLESIFARIDAIKERLNTMLILAGTLRSSLLYHKFNNLDQKFELKTLDDVCVNIQPGFAQGKKNIKGGIIHLRMNNITANFAMNFTLLRTVNATEKQKEKYELQENDVIFVNTNSTELIGKSAIFSYHKSCLFSNHLTRLRTNTSTLKPKYLLYYLWFKWMKQDFRILCSKHVNQSSINTAKIKQIQIPLPPLPEQHRIVSRIESIFAGIDAFCSFLLLKDTCRSEILYCF